MNLDEELAEILAGLHVVMEESSLAEPSPSTSGGSENSSEDAQEDGPSVREDQCPSELCLFQTSREHYGVFYRLDLVDGAPQLRVFLPDEAGIAKMRGYLVRAAPSSPLGAWFATVREYDGSSAYDEARDTTQQHLLFAAGELMKRLFWAGEPDEMTFPAEIAVRRVV